MHSATDLGRNETLADARTLQHADRAYVESGGSFQGSSRLALTSDHSCFRTAPTPLDPPPTTLGSQMST